MATLTTLSEAKIYVGTYGKYNNGSIEGDWLDLSDYSSKEEFYEACKELHSDEEDPEFMFQDHENIPDSLISESWLSDEIYDFIEIADKLVNYGDSDWVSLHNEFCRNNSRGDDEIFDFDEEFFNTFYDGKPMEAARAASFGELNWSDDYISFNGYANLVSTSNPLDLIDQEEIIKDILENPSNYSI